MIRSTAILVAVASVAACTAATPPPAPAPAPIEAHAPCPDAGPEEPLEYRPKPAFTGAIPVLPVPVAPVFPIKSGDAYTVRGAIHHLHSRVHSEEVNGKRITIVGYIARTNLDTVPKCAVHRAGKADPPDCRAPVPAFTLADDKGGGADVIEVMGWASNYAQIYSAIELFDRAQKGKEAQARYVDAFWGNDIPNPLPAAGAKVKVTGNYAIMFTKSAGGAAADPQHGILSYESIEVLEPAPAPARLPGMKPRK